jgi:ABC-type glutathione transport system ATPase component
MLDISDGLHIESLTKIYSQSHGKSLTGREAPAVNNVSFEVPLGASVAVVGESGAGKTTIARIVAGLEVPTSGSVHGYGQDLVRAARSPRDRRARAKLIQMVFQDPYSSLDPLQTVEATLREVLRLHSSEKNPKSLSDQISALLQQVGLTEAVRTRRPVALSGGQRQRVALARALATNPRLIVLDEAVASLDMSIRAQVLNLLCDLRAAVGVSYLFITHDLSIISRVSDSTIVLRGGRIVERGCTEQVVTKPQHPYTQLLVSSIPGPGWSLEEMRTARLRFREQESANPEELRRTPML